MATSKPKSTDPVEPLPRTISFKLTRNVMVPALSQFMKGGTHPTPPMRMRELPNTEEPVNQPGLDPHTKQLRMEQVQRRAVVPVFNMDAVYTITLEATEPREIARKPGQSDAWIEKLQDAEMTRALAAQERMDSLRRVLVKNSKPLVEGGVANIEIVDDASGYMTESSFLSDQEAEVAKREREEAYGDRKASLAAAVKGGS